MKISCEGTLDDFAYSLPAKCLEDICTIGSNDAAVSEWLELVSFDLCEGFSRMWLESLGIDDVDKMNLNTLKTYILWAASWNEFESRSFNQDEEVLL